MSNLRDLLRGFIDRRFAGTDSRLADRLGINRSNVSNVLSGKRPLSMKAIDEWADALDLSREERADFRLAVALANSPKEVRERLAVIERELDATKRLLNRIEAHPAMKRAARRPHR